jgi:hypothetical protein
MNMTKVEPSSDARALPWRSKILDASQAWVR